MSTVADVVAQLRSEMFMLERAADGCTNVACLMHGHDVQRVLDIDRQLRSIFAQLGIDPEAHA